MSDFCTSKRTTARKARSCPECGEAIRPGDTYVWIAGRSDDADFFTAFQCVPCHNFSKRYLVSLDRSAFLNDDEKTFHLGYMLNEAAEHLGCSPSQLGNSWPARRTAMLAKFDGFDAAELLHQARQRVPQRRPAPRYLVSLYSEAMSLGMASCSAPSPVASAPSFGGRA